MSRERAEVRAAVNDVNTDRCTGIEVGQRLNIGHLFAELSDSVSAACEIVARVCGNTLDIQCHLGLALTGNAEVAAGQAGLHVEHELAALAEL